MNKSIAKAFQKVYLRRIPLAGLQIKAVFRAGLAAVMFFIFTGGAVFSADASTTIVGGISAKVMVGSFDTIPITFL